MSVYNHTKYKNFDVNDLMYGLARRNIITSNSLAWTVVLMFVIGQSFQASSTDWAAHLIWIGGSFLNIVMKPFVEMIMTLIFKKPFHSFLCQFMGFTITYFSVYQIYGQGVTFSPFLAGLVGIFLLVLLIEKTGYSWIQCVGGIIPGVIFGILFYLLLMMVCGKEGCGQNKNTCSGGEESVSVDEDTDEKEDDSTEGNEGGGGSKKKKDFVCQPYLNGIPVKFPDNYQSGDVKFTT